MLLKDKKILILGLANHRSIAYGIAKACHQQGAKLALTYLNERFEKSVKKLAADFDEPLLLPCDVTKDDQIPTLFDRIREEWGTLDGLVHSIAFANQEDLKGAFHDTSRDGFLLAQDISAYSLTALSKYAKPLMEENGGSIICMSYLGGERVVHNYNVMGVAKASLEMSARYLASSLGEFGIRVNVVSPGPIKTLAASGIAGFRGILEEVRQRTPLQRNVTQEEVGDVSAFLLSDFSRAVTGETIHVDCGSHILGF
ncbi:Enoyl-[acyl-carrier-protein] reductase [NADH] [Sulfidibacter corallicola]|uniref:Enoyl-[acyl-carrier-protein] reductase [NADH] n=1 Tax=Sulfidibacter corallicola TaxID=2818388 RepID=A0A8A4TUH2_SULCO|nr:enoyl-ACP reductase [Sulfidibacter corallicola]QTD53616.1 enoyl-ACP reductase [Sulfidibacter corallicola]